MCVLLCFLIWSCVAVVVLFCFVLFCFVLFCFVLLSLFCFRSVILIINLVHLLVCVCLLKAIIGNIYKVVLLFVLLLFVFPCVCFRVPFCVCLCS